MINVIGELIDIEDKASKILKKEDNREKVFDEILEILEKEIELKIDCFVEKEIKKRTRREIFDQKKRLREIEFSLDSAIADMKKKFELDEEKWLDSCLEHIKKISEDS